MNRQVLAARCSQARLPAAYHNASSSSLSYPRVLSLAGLRTPSHPAAGASRSRNVGTCAAADTKVSSSAPATSFHHGITYTYYECNSFALRFNATGLNVLVDPWLVDDLVFFGQDGLFRGKKKMLKRQKVDVGAIGAETDLILISQYWPDHFHEPTLRLLPKTIPIVVSPAAEQQAKQLGFQSVIPLPHGKAVAALEGRLLIRATAGAEVGPPWVARENGYVLQEARVDNPVSVYYEPHCNFSEAALKEVGHVDVVVSPITSQVLGVPPQVGYPVVEGDVNLGRLAQLLTPKVVLATVPGDIENQGPLEPFIFERGTLDQAQEQLRKLGLSTKIELPAPSGEALAVAL